MTANPGSRCCCVDSDVLVVDDDAAYRRIVFLRLQAVGCACHTATTPEAALQLLETHPSIKTVLVDYHMGSTDVGSFVLEIRQSRPDIVIVGNSSMDRATEFEALGVHLFLRKPWANEKLIAILKGPLSD